MPKWIEKIEIPPIYNVIVQTWFKLLGVCGIITVLVNTSITIPYIYDFFIDIGKFGISMVLGYFWLFSWYNHVQMLLVYEQSRSEEISNSSTKIN